MKYLIERGSMLIINNPNLVINVGGYLEQNKCGLLHYRKYVKSINKFIQQFKNKSKIKFNKF